MAKISINVFVDRDNLDKSIELNNKSTVSDLLKELNINPVTVIVARNNELVLEDEELKNNDELKILSVISGG